MDNKGFFGGLFDLSFKEFVTIRVIKVLFVLAIIISGVVAVGVLNCRYGRRGRERFPCAYSSADCFLAVCAGRSDLA